MKNLIVIEGPRGSGKTTVVETVVRQAHHRDLHNVQHVKMQRPENPFLQMHKFLSDVESTPDLIFVCDRFALTELVMSGYYNRVKPFILRHRIQTIIWRMYELEALQIMLDVDLSVISSRLEDRADKTRSWDIPRDQVKAFWTQAYDFIKDCNSYIMPNQTPNEMQDIVDKCLQYITER